MSVLAQRFADPALGQLVVAHDALGVDAQQHVHAVPGPLGHLGGIDAAVQPGGQAGMAEVAWPPGEGRGLLSRGQCLRVPTPRSGQTLDCKLPRRRSGTCREDEGKSVPGLMRSNDRFA